MLYIVTLVYYFKNWMNIVWYSSLSYNFIMQTEDFSEKQMWQNNNSYVINMNIYSCTLFIYIF